MSNIERAENLKQMIMLAEPDFNQLAIIHGAVNFARESSFAFQLLKDNSYLATIAMGDQDSLRRAIINVAAIGLSLSPVHKLAYLVPRNKKVCLDISYRGYVQLALEVGAIKWAHADVVYKNDTFLLQGLGVEPLHKFEPFGDRGDIAGAYCVAKTHDGEFITTTMSADEILSVRDRSTSWQAYEKDNSKINPWVTDRAEMIKKTVIRRAYKSWPMVNTRQRLDEAVDVTSDFEAAQIEPAKENTERADSLLKIRSLLTSLERTEEKFVEHLVRANQRDIKKLEDLTEIEINQAITMLNTFAAKKTKETA